MSNSKSSIIVYTTDLYLYYIYLYLIRMNMITKKTADKLCTYLVCGESLKWAIVMCQISTASVDVGLNKHLKRKTNTEIQANIIIRR